MELKVLLSGGRKVEASGVALSHTDAAVLAGVSEVFEAARELHELAGLSKLEVDRGDSAVEIRYELSGRSIVREITLGTDADSDMMVGREGDPVSGAERTLMDGIDDLLLGLCRLGMSSFVLEV